jgi:hypothetical protein
VILVFQDDGSMRVIDSVAEANREYEAIDIENQEYTFLDHRGCELRPVLRQPTKKKWLFISVPHPVPFEFAPTDTKRDDLLTRLKSGEIVIDPRSSRVRALGDLQTLAPHLFTT